MMQVYEKKGKVKSTGIGTYVILAMVAATVFSTLLSIGLWLFGSKVAAAIIGTATFFGWLALFLVVIVLIVSWWTATLMDRGGQLVLGAQVSDDRRDSVLISQVGALTRDVIDLITERRTEKAPPPVPVDWLPAEPSFLNSPSDEEVN